SSDLLFGQQGTTGGGSAGGWISTLMGAFFGGAKAGGGDVLGSRAYLVGEQGPEMFVPRTSGAIIPAAKTEAMMSGRGGGGSITQNFINPRMTNMQTDQQRAREEARKAQRAMARA